MLLLLQSVGQLVGKRPGEKRIMKILKGVSGALQPVRELSDHHPVPLPRACGCCYNVCLIHPLPPC